MVVAALENFNDDTFTARASSSSCAETILAHQQIIDRVRGMLWCSIRIVYLMELTESAVCSVIRSLLQHRFFFFFFCVSGEVCGIMQMWPTWRAEILLCYSLWCEWPSYARVLHHFRCCTHSFEWFHFIFCVFKLTLNKTYLLVLALFNPLRKKPGQMSPSWTFLAFLRGDLLKLH